MKFKYRANILVLNLFAAPFLVASVGVAAGENDYTEPPVYDFRPKPTGEFHVGHVGVTGLELHGYTGVQLKVEKTTPGTPADKKFRKGEIVTGVNGVALKGTTRLSFWVKP
jgi:S1-C subfamily serine protease